MSSEIKLGIGLADLAFGSNRDEARQCFGEPDEICPEFEDVDTSKMVTEAWYYRALGFSLHFDEVNDFRLTTIEITSEDCNISGFSFIGFSKSDFLDVIRALALGSYEEEDSEGLLVFGDVAANFWFVDDSLKSIQWTPFWNDETDEFRWPK